MSKPTIVVNSNKTSGSVYNNGGIMSSKSTYFNNNNSVGVSDLATNNANTAYRVATIGTIYINGILNISPNGENYFTGGGLTGSDMYGSTYNLGTTLPTNPFYIISSIDTLEVGKKFNSAFLSSYSSVLTGTGVTATMNISMGLLHSDGSFSEFCNSGSIVVSATTATRGLWLPATTQRTAVAGDRIALKLTFTALGGTHTTGNYVYFCIATTASSGLNIIFSE